MSEGNTEKLRRDFLKFLAASPAVAAFGGVTAFLHEEGFAQEVRQSQFAEITRDRLRVVEDPKDALTVFDFEETARQKVQQGHWAYMASGTDDDATLRANRVAYQQVQLRPRRLRDATKVDMRTELFGERYAPHRRRTVVPHGWRSRRRTRDEGARRHADALHVDLDRSGDGKRGSRPAGVVSALCAGRMGGVRAAA